MNNLQDSPARATDSTRKPRSMKDTRTKIIATIGPACRQPEVLAEMIKAGMDVARINCSHSTPEFIESVVADVREISTRLDMPVGILLDLSGPKIRTRVKAPLVVMISTVSSEAY